MRLSGGGIMALGGALAMVLAGCAEVTGFDEQDPAQRTAAGAALGATLGAATGAMFAINPGLGALIGTGAGAVAGAAIAVATAEPPPSYAPIEPGPPAVPGFYDHWPPGYTGPPAGTETPPPPNRSG